LALTGSIAQATRIAVANCIAHTAQVTAALAAVTIDVAVSATDATAQILRSVALSHAQEITHLIVRWTSCLIFAPAHAWLRACGS